MAHPLNREEARQVGKRKLYHLYEETKNSYGAGAFMNDRGVLRKYSCNKKSVRQMHNRRFRHSKNWVNGNGGAYRKEEEYWWDIL